METTENKAELIEIFGKEIGKKNTLDLQERTVIKRAEIISKILKALRNKIGYTQKEISEKVGIAQQTYAGYESGKHEPSVEIIIRIADIYEVTTDYITGRWFGNDEYKYTEELINAKEVLERIYEMAMLEKMQADSNIQNILK